MINVDNRRESWVNTPGSVGSIGTQVDSQHLRVRCRRGECQQVDSCRTEHLSVSRSLYILNY